MGVFSCGNNEYHFDQYSFKGTFEVLMNDVTERAYLLNNLLNLESKTGEFNVVEYQTVEIDERQFAGLQQEIEKAWPAPVIIERESKVAAPIAPVEKEIVTEIKHIREEDKLRLAHEMLFGFTRSQDISLAIKIYEEEAAKDNLNAINSLGTIYE
jgi:hypothetical protein